MIDKWGKLILSPLEIKRVPYDHLRMVNIYVDPFLLVEWVERLGKDDQTNDDLTGIHDLFESVLNVMYEQPHVMLIAGDLDFYSE